MSGRITLERILRDDDDASGQSVRQWSIQKEGGMILLRSKDGADFILLRSADIDQLHEDLTAVDEFKG